MTNPTTNPADRITAAEIRERFDELETMIKHLTATIETMRGGLQTAATAPAVGTFGEMQIDIIIVGTDDNGKTTYKAKGAPYQKHGVRIWDEVLPTLGIDPATLKPGPNAITPAIRARVLMNQPEEGKTAQPRKVTGKA